jgi:hypothetical protein
LPKKFTKVAVHIPDGVFHGDAESLLLLVTFPTVRPLRYVGDVKIYNTDIQNYHMKRVNNLINHHPVSQPSFHASRAFQDASIPALHLAGLILSTIPSSIDSKHPPN